MSAAYSQQPPSEDELRSMYCVEVLRAEIALQRHLIAASDVAAANAASSALREQWVDTSAELLRGLETLERQRHRIQLYMLPRLPTIDSLALAVAIRQGDTDVDRLPEVAGRWAAACLVAPSVNQSPSTWNASDSDEGVLSRVSSCASLRWLPP